MVRPKEGKRTRFTRTGLLLMFIVASCLSGFTLVAPNAAAVTTVPSRMSFQGRLTGTSGTLLPDGTYNMKLRLYTTSTGGSAVWSEDRLVASSTGVAVSGGVFSIWLGDVTSLPASLFASGTLYLEVELPSPATATSSSPSWTEGAMTPRTPVTTSAYAFNSETLDGIDSSGFIQSTTTPQTGNIAVQSASAGSVAVKVKGAASQTADVVQVQDASGNNFLSVGSTGTVTIGGATNNILLSANGLIYSGTARPTKQVSLAAEYPGATFTADGSNNTGTLSSDFCSGSDRLNINASICGSGVTRNYYQWTTTSATAQDYDVYVRYQIPSDYSSGSLANLSILGWGTSTSTESVTAVLYSDASATACATTSNAVVSNATWGSATVSSPLGSCTIAAGDTVTFKVHLVAGQNNIARAGTISFSYRSQF